MKTIFDYIYFKEIDVKIVGKSWGCYNKKNNALMGYVRYSNYHQQCVFIAYPKRTITTEALKEILSFIKNLV